MISLVSTSRCVSCEQCVQVCPTNVFDIGPGGIPVIARLEDCQTCFMCEAYCPADALFVAAEAFEQVNYSEEELIEKGLLGAYRFNLGWSKGETPADRLKEMQELIEKVGSPY